MRTLLLVLACFLLTSFRTFAESLDVALEGPWIYYVDNKFQGEAGPVSVLIAMAPLVPNHKAAFSTGDGYPITQAGVYCVGFEDHCAVDRKAATGALPSELLPVFAPKNWDWYANRQTDVIYLILPMPDSYSNDLVYRMKFGRKFSHYRSEEHHSIGLFLHYLQGPSLIGLSSNCTKPDALDCHFDNYFQDQNNSGALQITMKAPDDSDPCDNHVREAYHRMVLTIDQGSLANKKNVNQNFAYIDLPDYSSACYSNDPQNDGSVAAHTMQDPEAIDVTSQLRKIVTDLAGEPVPVKTQLYVPQLNDIAETLDGQFPMFSQLAHINLLLDLSLEKLDHLQKEQDNPSARSNNENDGVPQDRTQAKKDEEILLSYVKFLRSGRSGKDCRAPQMFITQIAKH